MMIPNLISIIVLLILGTPILILIMFLPAILELRKPKDGGPRMIMDNVLEVRMQLAGAVPLVSIEEEQRFDSSLIRPLAQIIDALPSLEI
jgi:hypothetical protein